MRFLYKIYIIVTLLYTSSQIEDDIYTKTSPKIFSILSKGVTSRKFKLIMASSSPAILVIQFDRFEINKAQITIPELTIDATTSSKETISYFSSKASPWSYTEAGYTINLSPKVLEYHIEVSFNSLSFQKEFLTKLTVAEDAMVHAVPNMPVPLHLTSKESVGSVYYDFSSEKSTKQKNYLLEVWECLKKIEGIKVVGYLREDSTEHELFKEEKKLTGGFFSKKISFERDYKRIKIILEGENGVETFARINLREVVKNLENEILEFESENEVLRFDEKKKVLRFELPQSALIDGNLFSFLTFFRTRELLNFEMSCGFDLDFYNQLPEKMDDAQSDLGILLTGRKSGIRKLELSKNKLNFGTEEEKKFVGLKILKVFKQDNNKVPILVVKRSDIAILTSSSSAFDNLDIKNLRKSLALVLGVLVVFFILWKLFGKGIKKVNDSSKKGWSATQISEL